MRKEECIRPNVPLTLADAKSLVGTYVVHYNTVRLHSAIGIGDLSVTPLLPCASLISLGMPSAIGCSQVYARRRFGAGIHAFATVALVSASSGCINKDLAQQVVVDERSTVLVIIDPLSC
ncbi:MAG: hypothetical protein ABMA00_14135 [Gemmatimonas sp.]